jgi:hypothetical protein
MVRAQHRDVQDHDKTPRDKTPRDVVTPTALPARTQVDFGSRAAAIIAVGHELGLPASSIPSPNIANSNRTYLKWINNYRAALALPLLPGLDYSGFVPALNAILASAGAVLRPEVVTAPYASSNATPPVVGSVLTSTVGTWLNTPTSYTYQWKRNGTTNIGTSVATYTIVSADLGGNSITCDVTAVNAAGSSTPSTSNAVQVP